MSNNFFQFKQFKITQEGSSMKVTTDACLFGAWCAEKIRSAPIKNILDIGTGTGLLSLMVAQQNHCLIDAVEIESLAADEAKQNVKDSPWGDQIRVIESDITVISLKKYDCIISNPPFYENDLKTPSNEKNIAHHSQLLNLQDLLNIIKGSLDDKGFFFLLLPYRRKDEILLMLEKTGCCVYEMVTVFHSPKHVASRIMIKAGFENSGFQKMDIFIKNNGGEYSAEFVSLLKGYFLYL